MTHKFRNLFWLSLLVGGYLFASDTETILYRPFSPSPKHPALTITTSIPGHCEEQSYRIKREDAWRCYAQDAVYDPCYVKRFGPKKEALCPESPWSSNAIKIILDAPIDEANHASLDMSRTYPWAIELASGAHCVSVLSDALYDGLKLRYRCNDDSVLVGRLQRCKAKWEMLRQTNQGSSLVLIQKAWF